MPNLPIYLDLNEQKTKVLLNDQRIKIYCPIKITSNSKFGINDNIEISFGNIFIFHVISSFTFLLFSFLVLSSFFFRLSSFFFLRSSFVCLLSSFFFPRSSQFFLLPFFLFKFLLSAFFCLFFLCILSSFVVLFSSSILYI